MFPGISLLSLASKKKKFHKEVTLTCALTRVEQDDSFETHELLGFELERAEAGRGGQQHVEDLGHAFNTGAFIPGQQDE